MRIAIETNAGAGQEFWFSSGVAQYPHFLNSCDVIFGIGGICYPFATHADGSLVSTSAPARPGEVLVLYAVGLGLTQSGGETGRASASPDPITGDFYLSWGYFVDTPPGSPAPAPRLVQSGQWIKADFAGLVQGFVGLYQVNLRLPDFLPEGIRQCYAIGNFRLLVGPTAAIGNYRESIDICVQQ